MMHRIWPAAVVALVVVGAGCGSDAASDDAGAIEPTDSSATTATVTRAQLASVLQGGFFDEQSTDAVLIDCMAASGFLWISASGQTQGAAMSDSAFVDTYGYGVTTFVSDSGEVDPNLQYFDSLDANAQGAYNLALVGNPAGEAPISDDSCLALEQETLGAATEAISSQIVVQALDEYSSRIATDPGVTAANEAWVDCIGSSGYAYASRDDIIGELSAQAEQPLSSEQLIALQQQEREIARVDFDCSDGIREATQKAADALIIELLDKYTPE